MSEKKTILSRRNFLLTVGAGGVASAAAVVARKPAGLAKASAGGKRGGAGYTLSEHVSNYYRTTKV